MKNTVLLFLSMLLTICNVVNAQKIKTTSDILVDNTSPLTLKATLKKIDTTRAKYTWTGTPVTDTSKKDWVKNLTLADSLTDYTINIHIDSISNPETSVVKTSDAFPSDIFLMDLYAGRVTCKVYGQLQIFGKDKTLIKSISLLGDKKPVMFNVHRQKGSSEVQASLAFSKTLDPKGWATKEEVENTLQANNMIPTIEYLGNQLHQKIIADANLYIEHIIKDIKYQNRIKIYTLKKPELSPEIDAQITNLRNNFNIWKENPQDTENQGKLLAIANDFMAKGKETDNEDLQQLYYIDACLAFTAGGNLQKACEAYALGSKLDSKALKGTINFIATGMGDALVVNVSDTARDFYYTIKLHQFCSTPSTHIDGANYISDITRDYEIIRNNQSL